MNALLRIIRGLKPTLIAIALICCSFSAFASTWTATFLSTSNNWSNTNNWSGGVPNATGAVADFGASISSPSQTVTNDIPATVGVLIFGNTSGAAPLWTVTGSGNNNLTLAVASGSPTNTVNNVQEFIGGLRGTQGFVKNGNGAMALYGNNFSNVISGAIFVNAGLLGTVNGKAFTYVSGNVTVASGASFEANAAFDGTVFSNAFFLSGAGGAASGYAGNVSTPDGTYNGEPQPFGALDLHGNASISGPITLNSDSKITHGFNFGTISGDISGSGKNLQLAVMAGGQFPLNVNGNINLGSGVLTVSGIYGASYVGLSGSNTMSGVTILTNGIAYFSTTNAIGASGQCVTVNSGGAASMGGFDLRPLLVQIVTSSAGAIVFNSTNSSTNLDFTGYSNLSLGSIGNSVYSGTITPAGGTFRLGGGTGNLTVNSTLSGTGTGLVINGNGMVTLAGATSYTGTTTVMNGLLSEAGTLQGPLVVQASGALLPGVSGVGTLTVNGPVSLNGTLRTTINRGASPNATLLTANSLFLGGAVIVTNAGAAPVSGDSFQLFSVPVAITNGFPAFSLPSLSTGLMWDTSGLVTNGTLRVVAVTNYVGDTNYPGLLPQQIIAAYSNGVSSVTIAPGTYYMPDALNQNFGFPQNPNFNFNSFTNFTINASNTLFLVGTNIAFTFNNCSNVTLRSAVVRSVIPTCTQGRVISIGTDANGNANCNWKIDDGYPTNNIYWNLLNAVVGSTRNFRVEAGDMYNITNFQFIGNQTYTVHFNTNTIGFQTNDWLVSRLNSWSQQGFAFYLSGSRNCTLQNLASESGSFATYREIGGGGNRMIGCQIRLAPVVPPGGSELPVVADSADGLHTVGTFPGMDIENCVFQGVFLDDNLAINGTYQSVIFSSGNVVVLDGAGSFAVGDPIRLSSTSGFFAQANCTAITSLPGREIEAVIDQSLSIPAGAKASNPKYNGQNYKLINCSLGNTRSRSILCKGDNGLISGCVISNSGSGMQLGPEYSFNESDYVSNVVVTSNSIFNCGSAGIYFIYNGSAIGNKNITISDNHVQNVIQGDSLQFKGCNLLNLVGNTIVNPAPGYSSISFSSSTNITLAENLVTNAPVGANLLGIGSGVGGIQNQLNGIYLAGVPYTFINQLSGLVLAGGGVGVQASQQVGANISSMYWSLSSLSNGYCALVCTSNGLVLGVNGSTASGAPLVMESYTGADGQLWSLAPVTNASVALTNKLSGLAASVQTAAAGDGLVQLTWTNGTNQQWLLVPLAPANLTATPVSTGVKLNWGSVVGAGSYNVKRATSLGGPFVTIAPGVAGTTYTDTTAVVGTTYYYEVSAIVGGAETVNSTAVTVFAMPVPTWFSLQQGDARVDTNYTTVNTNGLLLATNYTTKGTYIESSTPNANYLYNTNLWVGTVQTPPDTNRILLAFDLAPLLNTMAGFSYNITGANLVLTHRTAADGLNSGVALLTTTPFDDSTATWNSPGGGAPAGGTLGTLIVNQGMIGTNQYPTPEVYTNAGLDNAITNALGNATNKTIYLLLKRNTEAVASFNNRFVTQTNTDPTYGGLDSRPQLQILTSIVTNLPPPPANLSITALIGSIQLSWSSVAGASSYNVKRATIANGPFVTIASGITNTTYTDTNVVSGTAYYYEVSAIIGGFETFNSSLTTVFIVPAPTWFSLQAGDVRVGTNYTSVNTNGILLNTNYTTEGTYIETANPNANFLNNSNLWVGTVQAPPDTNRILLAFDLSPMLSTLAGYSYSLAGANLVLTHRTPGDSLNSGMALWTTTPFDDSTATWNNPGGGAPAGGTLGTLIVNQGMIGTNQYPTTEVYTNTGLNSAITNAWANTTSKTIYLLIRRNTEAATSFNDRFVTQANTDPAYGGIDSRPQLQIGVTIITNTPGPHFVISNPAILWITSIVLTDAKAQIDFEGSESDAPESFSVQAADGAQEEFTNVPAEIVQISSGRFRATLVINGTHQFFRIQRK